MIYHLGTWAASGHRVQCQCLKTQFKESLDVIEPLYSKPRTSVSAFDFCHGMQGSPTPYPCVYVVATNQDRKQILRVNCWQGAAYYLVLQYPTFKLLGFLYFSNLKV